MVFAHAPPVAPRLTEAGLAAFFMPNAMLFYALYRARSRRSALAAVAAFVAAGLVLGWTGPHRPPALLSLLAIDIAEAAALARLTALVTVGRLGPRGPKRAFVLSGLTLLVVACFGTLAATALILTQPSAAAAGWTATWRDWWLGNSVAYLTLGAVLLLVGRRTVSKVLGAISQRPVEFALAIAFLMLAVLHDMRVLPGLATLLGDPTGQPKHLAFVFMTLPAMLWLALRFHQLGAAAGIALTSVPAVHLVALGWGADWPGPIELRVVTVQVYVAVTALAAYLVAALASQSRRRRRMQAAALRRETRSLRARADFVSRINHEMRTPLNGIAGLAHLIKHEAAGPLPEQYRAWAGLLESSAVRLTAMVERALDLSQVLSHRPGPALTPVDLAGVAREAIRQVEGLAAAKSVRLELEASAMVRTAGNRAGLLLAATNLLTNAIKAVSHGGRVAVRIAQQGHLLCLEVGDDGPGFPPGFAIGAGGVPRGDGSAGLGLHVVTLISSAHGGHLALGTSPEGGALITLALPWHPDIGPAALGDTA